MASNKHDHSYKIFQCNASFCATIILVSQLLCNREDNKASFELLMMKIDQILLNYTIFCEKKAENALPILDLIINLLWT